MTRSRTKPKKRNIRWEFLIPGIALGCAGVGLLSGTPNWLFGLPVQALSLWALWAAFPPESGTIQPHIAKNVPSSGMKADWKFLFGLAVTAWMLSQVCFQNRWWIAGAIAAGLLFWAMFRITKWRPEARQSRDFFPKKTALALLMLLTVFLRFPFLNQNFAGLQADEGFNLLNAIKVLQGEPDTPFGSNSSWFYMPRFILAGVMTAFGFELNVARGFSALLSTLFVYFFYRWCRLYFGVAASWLASAFFSYCWWNLFFSLSIFSHIYTELFEILAFFSLAKAIQEGRRLYFALAGLFAALSIMTYYSGFLVPVMMVTALIAWGLLEKRDFLKTHWKHFLLTVLCFLWLAGPFLVFLHKYPSELLGRARDLSVLGAEGGRLALPLIKMGATFYSLFWPNHAGVDHRFGLEATPCLDPLWGIFCLLGLVLALRRFSLWKNLAAVTGVVFGILANTFSYAEGADQIDPYYFHAGRVYFMLPFLCFLMAQGVDGAWGFFAAGRKPARKAWILFCAVMLAASLSLNTRHYFFGFGSHRLAWADLGFNHVATAEAIKSLYPSNHIVVESFELKGFSACPCYDSVEKFLSYRKVPVNLGISWDLPIRARVQKNVALFFGPQDDYRAKKEMIRRFYPRAEWKHYRNKFGDTYLISAEIAKEDIQRLQKGLKLKEPLL